MNLVATNEAAVSVQLTNEELLAMLGDNSDLVQRLYGVGQPNPLVAGIGVAIAFAIGQS